MEPDPTPPFGELSLRDLLRILVHPQDADRLAVPGVAIGDLARPGLAGPAAMAAVRPLSRRRLAAAFELARRRERGERPARPQIGVAPDVVRLLRPEIGDAPVEVFRVLLLDARHRVLALPEVSRGTLSTSLVHPREVFRPAILAQAAAVIIAHNHPSGDPDPSPEDRVVTRRIAEAGTLLGIPLLDHVIIGEARHYSFREAGTSWL